MPEILITTYYTHKPGGLCKRLYRLLRALKVSDRKVIFYTLDPEHIPVDLNDITVRIPFCLASRKGIIFWGIFSVWLPLFILYKHFKKPASAFIFNPYYGLLLFPLRVLGVVTKITYFFRSVGSKTYQARGMHLFAFLISKLEWFSVSTGDALVAQTEVMKEELTRNVFNKKLKWYLLPNDAPRFDNVKVLPELNSLNCIVVGQFDRGKNLELLLKVFKELPEVTLLVVGAGGVLEQLSKNSSANINFLGWQNEVRGYIEKAHILIHPSLNEGMPNAVLEGLGLGRVVLASRTKEHKEVLGFDELLFDPLNYLELLEKLKKIDSQQLRDLLSLCESRKKELTFDWESLSLSILT